MEAVPVRGLIPLPPPMAQHRLSLCMADRAGERNPAPFRTGERPDIEWS